MRGFPAVDLAPLATLPHLRELMLAGIDEPVDLSPLARTSHRLRVELWNTSTVGRRVRWSRCGAFERNSGTRWGLLSEWVVEWLAGGVDGVRGEELWSAAVVESDVPSLAVHDGV
ncbi:MAG: hypothetical protein M3332_11305, partial [Actinomycetota bacterium]|nr:hypothetical protein [Actinomycetota bacterium]